MRWEKYVFKGYKHRLLLIFRILNQELYKINTNCNISIITITFWPKKNYNNNNFYTHYTIFSREDISGKKKKLCPIVIFQRVSIILLIFLLMRSLMYSRAYHQSSSLLSHWYCVGVIGFMIVMGAMALAS